MASAFSKLIRCNFGQLPGSYMGVCQTLSGQLGKNALMYHLCHWSSKKGDRQPPVMQLVRGMQPIIERITTLRVGVVGCCNKDSSKLAFARSILLNNLGKE